MDRRPAFLFGAILYEMSVTNTSVWHVSQKDCAAYIGCVQSTICVYWNKHIQPLHQAFVAKEEQEAIIRRRAVAASTALPPPLSMPTTAVASVARRRFTSSSSIPPPLSPRVNL